MSSIETFNFTGHQLRVVTINGAPWFVAADVRNTLGMARHGKWLDHLGADEKRIIRECGGASLKGHGLVVLSESGLYKLIMRSDKPQARQYQDWVTREVLPSIRKSGGYMLKGADHSKIQEGTVSEGDLASLTTKLVGGGGGEGARA